MSNKYLTVKQAAARFRKSVKTIYRLINRITADDAHGDRQQVQPSPEDVIKLQQQHRKIQYTINTELLERRFGEPPAVAKEESAASEHDQQQQSPDIESSSVIRLYQERIADLKEQVSQARQREKEMRSEAKEREQKLLQYAQSDKQLFANANENLTQVLALPGITEATKAQQGSAVPNTPSAVILDSSPAPKNNQSTTKSKADMKHSTDKKKRSKSATKKTDKTPTNARRSWLTRTLFGQK